MVATPHLGASTVEAQDKAGLAVARSVKLALQGEFVPDAVNVQAGGVVAEDVRPLLPLAEKLGRVFTAVAGGVAASVTVEVRGEIVVARRLGAQARRDQGPVRLGGRGAGHLRQRAAAGRGPRRRGRAGRQRRGRPSTTNLVTVRGALPDGRTVSVSGTVTVTGAREVRKLTEVDGFDLELGRRGRAAVLPLRRPAGRGRHRSASLLGEAGVNIAAMQVARREAGGEALMTLTVDSSVDAELLSSAPTAIGATAGSMVDLRVE